jgi:SP family arabinose:H+ symporter-like MFS transporter
VAGLARGLQKAQHHTGGGRQIAGRSNACHDEGQPGTGTARSIGIGITNLVFTFVGLWLIDRLGRRTLLIVGSLGYILSLGLCAWALATGNTSIVPACIFAFIAAHAVGQGAVSSVFTFFCGMMILQLVWVLAMVPKTKGVPLEEIARRLRA